ncbi:MAG: hypothetical protein CMH62_00970 [Nanoarchaeota archaeon]|nr:hypothetical protein [Nanoarchaeota archaeon]|tara:strand:+ start:658 stop:1353 length:696 start_codon:yes stop_codon:yes gene_type:complete
MYCLTDSQKVDLAYLIGAVIGDGSYMNTKSGKRRNIRFSFGSSDREFVVIIKDIIRDIFSLELNICVERLSLKNNAWRDHYKIRSRILHRHLKKYLPDKNKIPSFVYNSNHFIKSSFISGFFDAEGGICVSTIKSRNVLDRRLYCHNFNIDLLNEIKGYLSELDIDCFIQNSKRAYALNIWGYKNLVNFKNKIDFRIYRKRFKLLGAINSYKFVHKKYRHLKVDVQNLGGI